AGFQGRMAGAAPKVDGAVLSERAFALRFFTPGHAEDRVLIVNLGGDLERASFAEPLLAPPSGAEWRVRWSSETAIYGGSGTPDLRPDDRWHIPGEAAPLLPPHP